jgi:Cu-processing system permease protein
MAECRRDRVEEGIVTRSLIVTGRELSRVSRGKPRRVAFAFFAAIALGAFVLVGSGGYAGYAAIEAASSAIAAAESPGRLAASISNLLLIASSLAGILVAALSFSLDETGGMAALVRSCGLGRREYILGKFAGLTIAPAALIGATTVVALAIAGPGGGLASVLPLLASVLATSAVYAAWGSFFGTSGRSALAAAGASISFWFITLFLYEALGWAIFPVLPYRVAKPALALFLAADPAESLRLGAIFLAGRGAALGPEFYYWQLFFRSPIGIVAGLAILAAHVALPLSLAAVFSRRKA